MQFETACGRGRIGKSYFRDYMISVAIRRIMSDFVYILHLFTK